MDTKPKVIIDARAKLGESPSWDNINNQLLWVDIIEKKLHVYNPETHENKTYAFEQNVSAVAPRNKSEVILAMKSGFHIFNLETKKLTFINDPEKNLPSNRFNDGKCDPFGRFWAGTMDINGKENCGALYCLDNNFAVKQKLQGVSVSNGLAWSVDGRKMYYIDTPTNEVVMFDYSLETGKIENQRTIIKIPKSQGSPDGMTMDDEGMLWIAHWGGGKVSRYNPVSALLLTEIHLPCSYVTLCVFGGKELDILFITTARVESDQNDFKKTYAGGVFAVNLNIKGTPTYHFNENTIL